MNDVKARLEVAVRAAREAGLMTLSYYQSPGLKSDAKGDGSPVTVADKKGEELIRAIIERDFGADAILGEEFPEKQGSTGYRWIIDPIDGTRSFTRGIPHYAVLIGVEHEGRAVVGAVEVPALGERLSAGRGLGGWWTARDGSVRPARVSHIDELKLATVEMNSGPTMIKHGLWPVFEAVSRSVARTRGWSDAYAFVLAATGRVDVALGLGFSPWDIAPFQAIMEEAGGAFTSWGGESSIRASRIVASNGRFHTDLLRVLAPGAG